MKTKTNIRSTRLHIVLGAALLGLLVTPLAVAGAADSQPVAGASKVTDAKFKKLKQRIGALEAALGQNRPTGPAEGDLTGQYPAPRIAENAVASTDVAADSLGAIDIAPNGVGSSELATGSVGIDELANDTVGGGAFKGVVTRHGNGASANGAYAEDSVSCINGEQLIAGGYAWTSPAVAGTVTTTNAPSEGAPNTTWIVGGRAPSANSIFAWAVCLQA